MKNPRPEVLSKIAMKLKEQMAELEKHYDKFGDSEAFDSLLKATHLMIELTVTAHKYRNKT